LKRLEKRVGKGDWDRGVRGLAKRRRRQKKPADTSCWKQNPKNPRGRKTGKGMKKNSDQKVRDGRLAGVYRKESNLVKGTKAGGIEKS